MRLLVGKTAAEVQTYADRHTQQFGTSIEVRKSKELHDRLIVQDNGDVLIAPAPRCRGDGQRAVRGCLEPVESLVLNIEL